MVQHKRSSAQRFAQVVAELYAHLRPEYDEDLTHQSVRLLQHIALANKPLRVEDVRQFLGGAAPSASEFVKRLAVRGLVARERSEADARVVELKLTDKGAEVLRQHTQLDLKRLEIAARIAKGVDLAELTEKLEALLAAAAHSRI